MNLLKYENLAIDKGYKVIAGVDEVGLGSLAGPVVACAVAIDKQSMADMKKIHAGRNRIFDSKRVPKEAREKMYKRILGAAYAVGMGIVDVPELNKIKNIRKSGYLARYRAVHNLGRSNNYNCHIYWHPLDLNLEYALKFNVLYSPVVPHYIMVDGNFGMPEVKDVPVKSIVGGDGKSLAIAAASIIAKVYRDGIMTILHALYPQYGWDHNAGYGTKWHIDALLKYGESPVHRKHFVKGVINGR